MGRTTTVKKGEFAYEDGRFYALPYILERTDTKVLKDMFIPKLSAEGRKILRGQKGRDFVRANLKHYGIDYSESDFTSNGASLMKKALLAGKCDSVPDRILKLQDKMRKEWISRLTPEVLGRFPNYIAERYFLTSGQPDPAKTTSIVAIPTDEFSVFSAKKVIAAAESVPGLYFEAIRGPETHTVYMGWDQAAVKEAAAGHVAMEAKKKQDKADAYEAKLDAKHKAYLSETLAKQQKGEAAEDSPVGSYVIRCKEIETQWPGQSRNLTMDIRPTRYPLVFEADFSFGILEGAMLMSTSENELKDHVSVLEWGDVYMDEEEEEDEGDKGDKRDEGEDKK